MSRFVPIAANASSTCAFAPSPMATIAMTAPTPMMMPSVVRNERILLRKQRAQRDAQGLQRIHACTSLPARGSARSTARIGSWRDRR